MPTSERADLDRVFATVVDADRGELTVDGQLSMVVDGETFAEIQREMEGVLGRGAEPILARAGYLRGSRLAVRLSTLVEGRPDAFVEGLRVFAAQTGLCRLDEVRTSDARVAVRLRNSFIGRAYGPSPGPVCHYLRGFVLAAAEHLVHRRDVECREVRCAAMGADACEFEVVPAMGSDAALAPLATGR